MSDDTRHPLDDVFKIDHGSSYDEDDKESLFSADVNVPKNPELASLDDIIRLALSAYEQQMKDVSFIEPKHRTKYYEVCERFLNQAKDAMVKREQLKQKASQTKEKNKENPKDESNGVKTNELFEKAKQLKAVK